MPISVTDPVSAAINRAKAITFQPFNLGKWFVLGFIAFLANLGEGGGGGNYNFNFPRGGPAAPPPVPRPGGGGFGTQTRVVMPDFLSDLWNWASANVPLAILLGVGIAVAGLGIWMLMIWLSSRAQFMFIEAIAQNTSEVRSSWARHRELGNSLFKFRAAITGIGWLVSVIIASTALVLAWPDIQNKTFGPGATTAIIIAVVGLLPIGLAAGIVSFLTHNFITPIMYATGSTVMPAWTEFRTIVLPGHAGTILLYLVMRILLLIGVGIASMMIGCATCCLGFLPYLSSVATLPLSIFLRAYSLFFVEQFDRRYAVVLEVIEPPVYGFPVIQPNQPPPSQRQ